jgi:phospholipid/cholesterol/gamma-HCH transport system substrate-binding protein
MMHRNIIETVMGAVVLVVAALFIYFAYTTAQVRTGPGYELTAVFSTVGGLAPGSDVRISGIKVGTVQSSRLDPGSYNAVVVLTVAEDVRLPADTLAVVASEGVLGGRYLELRPGRSTALLQAGGRISETRAYRSLEDQVGEIIFLATAKPGDGSDRGTTPAPEAPSPGLAP